MWTEYPLTPAQFKDLKKVVKSGAKLADTRHALKTSICVLDSVDGRLLRAGYLALWHPMTGRSGMLVVRDANSFVRHVELSLRAQPAVPQDLPPYLLGGTLHAALSQRALVVLAKVSALVQTAVLKVKSQTIADITALLESESERACIWVDERRGFSDEIRAGFTSIKRGGKTPLLIEQLAGKARGAADLNSKGFPALKKDQTTASALRTLHERLLAQMLSQVGGTAADLDIEFLHELRVASRRARSLLQTMPGQLAPTQHAHATDTYRWIGQQTTDLRDLDVYLADFPALEKAVSHELAGALEPFKKSLQKQRVIALRRVRNMLKSKRFTAFEADWTSALKSGEAFSEAARSNSIEATASKAIWKRYRRICRDGAAITSDTPAEALHDLRKQGKKLRYLLEFFASLYPAETIKPRIKELKNLQDLLGAYQDCAVQAAFLETNAAKLRQDMTVPAETLMAMGALADQRLQDEKRLRTDFDRFFAAFSSPAEYKTYKSITQQ